MTEIDWTKYLTLREQRLLRFATQFNLVHSCLYGHCTENGRGYIVLRSP